MVTKMKIPVIDTESGKYDYNGRLSREEYSEMVISNYWKTTNQIDRFVGEMMAGVQHNRGMSEYKERAVDGTPDILYNDYEAEVFLSDAKKKDVDENFFVNKNSAGKMFLLRLNINPNSMEGDAESEIRFWVDDSKKVHSDNALDDKMKLKILPRRSLIIELPSNKEALLSGCKVIQDFSDKKFPFNFAIIVEKIDIM